MGKRVAVTGTLTRIDWINPHIVVAMETKGDGGKTDHWTFESNPPSWYRGVGLARADFARVLIVASELAAASHKVYDVFDEPGSAGDDRDIALQLEAVP